MYIIINPLVMVKLDCPLSPLSCLCSPLHLHFVWMVVLNLIACYIGCTISWHYNNVAVQKIWTRFTSFVCGRCNLLKNKGSYIIKSICASVVLKIFVTDNIVTPSYIGNNIFQLFFCGEKLLEIIRIRTGQKWTIWKVV